jgi:hypothetical protein
MVISELFHHSSHYLRSDLLGNISQTHSVSIPAYDVPSQNMCILWRHCYFCYDDSSEKADYFFYADAHLNYVRLRLIGNLKIQLSV